MAADEGQESVVALSRWRAVLARSRHPRKRLDLVLSDPQAASLVPRIPIEDFYYLVRGVGLADALDVLRLASPEQLQGCLDLDLWERDRVSAARAFGWLEMLAELTPRGLAAVMRLVDAELAALLVGRYANIYDRTVREGPAEDTRHILYRTPDAAFVVELKTPDATSARTLERFLAQLYDADPDRARSILSQAKWATTAELEEESYHWRTARLADLGFPSYDEALEVYRYTDPRRVAVAPPPPPPDLPEDSPMLPAPLAEAIGTESFLGRVLADVDDATRIAELTAAIVGTLNRVLVADRVDPGDIEAVREASARVRDTLSLGLEHLSGGDVERALTVVLGTPMITIFRVGFSLTVDLARRARALDRAGVIDPTIDPLLEPRPLFPSALDPEPTAGVRPFRTRGDLEAVGAYLADLEANPTPD